MSTHLDALSDVIRRTVGMQLEKGQHPALRAALLRAWPGIEHAEVLRRTLDPVTGPGVIVRLIDEITIKETSFLRDRSQLASIDWQALRTCAQATGSGVVRVWSAACATGAEPYSLALLACEAFASTNPPVRILATDISSAARAATGAGRYRARTVHGVEEPLRSRYLARCGDDFAVIPTLRALVTVTGHNLVSDAYPPAGEPPFHLILCRNVLIYFDSDTCTRVVAGLERALVPGGRLMLGAADALCVPHRVVGEARSRPTRGNTLPAQVRARRSRPQVVPAVPPAPPAADMSQMDPETHYRQGLDALESGDAAAAVESLRRVLYLDRDFELAAFALGRAHEKAGEPVAARRSYEQALRMLAARPEPGTRAGGAIDIATVIDACEARLAALGQPAPRVRRTPADRVGRP